MKQRRRFDVLPSAQQASIVSLTRRINDWFMLHPKQKACCDSISLIGSRAVGLADPGASNWDLYVIGRDSPKIKSTLANDISMHEDCATQWFGDTVWRYFDGVNSSSLDPARVAEKFGISLYGELPSPPAEESHDGSLLRPNIDAFLDVLSGVIYFGTAMPSYIQLYLRQVTRGFASITKNGEPYCPALFLNSSQFAEQVCLLMAWHRKITPLSFHQLDVLASQFELDDPFRERIACLKGMTREAAVKGFVSWQYPSIKEEDESVDSSKSRLALALSLLADFLSNHAHDIEPSDEDLTPKRRLLGFIESWNHSVLMPLTELAATNPSETWLSQLAHNASVIAEKVHALLLDNSGSLLST